MLTGFMALPAHDDADVRKELEAQYLRLAEAHEKRDHKAIVGLKTADFHAIFPDGRVGDSQQMEQYSRQFLEINEPRSLQRLVPDIHSLGDSSVARTAPVMAVHHRSRAPGGRIMQESERRRGGFPWTPSS